MNVSIKSFGLSIAFHSLIFILFIVSSLIYKESQTFKINIHEQGSIYVNMVSQKNFTKNLKKEKPLDLKDNNIKSNIEYQSKKSQDQKEEQIKNIQQQNLGNNGNNTDENNAFSNVIEDQSLLSYKTPAYPQRAIDYKQQGEVIVRLLVDSNNFIKKVVIYKSSGYSLLDQSVLNTIKYWQVKRHLTQDTWFQVRVNFVLQ